MLLALIMLTGVERGVDGDRLTLTFDAPVTFTQAMATAPPRIIINVPEAQADPEMTASANFAHVALTPGADPRSLRIVVPIPEGSSASVRASGSRIVVGFESTEAARPPASDRAVVLPGPGSATAVRPMTGGSDLGGIPASGDSAAAMADYVIGPEDLLEVNVFELPELKTTTRVLGDGTVSLPLLGVVPAAGLTKTGFEARLRDLLEARFLLDPQVTIAVTEFRSKQVSVIGAVTKPGTFEMIGPRSVLQMISEAGGLTKEAGADILILRKTESGQVERLHLDLDDLFIKGNPELNLALAPGDVINVPIDRPIYVFVDGAVKSPGQVESKSSRPITLLQAVSRAGGLSERANLRGVHILRRTADGSQQRIPVNLREIRKGKADDIDLQDGDVVVVPETFF